MATVGKFWGKRPQSSGLLLREGDYDYVVVIMRITNNDYQDLVDIVMLGN